MHKRILIFVFVVSLGWFALAGTASASTFSQVVNLDLGWNVVSTPRVLESHSFSADETSANFDIYILDASSVSGWSTMADLGQSEFTPLYGYFINNKVGTEQTLTLNYKDGTTPNERLFERTFTETGWYSVGVANPTYAKKSCSNDSDRNNVSSILDSLKGYHSAVVDFTTTSLSVAVSSQWTAVVPSNLNSLWDFRDTKGYAIYINKTDALYSGFQNTNNLNDCVSEPTTSSTVITVIFNGPAAGNLTLSAQDANIFDFTIFSPHNVEIRNLRFSNLVTSAAGGFDDFKVWDIAAGSVITSAIDVTSSTNLNPVFTDTVDISAGRSKRFRVTTDVDSLSVNNDNITVTLLPFQANDIRDLDNNTYVATVDIIGDNAQGNIQTVRTPVLDVQLAALPVSQTYAQGAQDIDVVGIALRAVNDDIKLSSLRIYASSSNAVLTSGELQNLKLFVDGVQIGPTKGLDSSLTATFDNLNYTITKGVTKVFTVKGSISASATGADRYYVYLNALNDITAYDSDGNTLMSGSNGITGTTANSGYTVVAIVTQTGNLAVARAADDVESEAGILIANGQAQVLAKFRWTATDETMTLNDLDLFVNDDNTSNTASSTVDEVGSVEIWVGGTKLGTYFVQVSGGNMGRVTIQNLSGFVIPKDNSLVMTVKGVVNTIANGADSGAEVAVHVLKSNFKAVGSTSSDTTLSSGASGNEKVVYKTKPTLSVVKPSGSIFATGAVKVMRLTVAADANEDIAWRKVQLYVAVTDATMTGATVNNVRVRDVSSGTNLTLSVVHSAGSTSGTGANDIKGGATGYISITLTAEQVVHAGTSKSYDISLTFEDVDAGGNGGQSISANLHQQASAKTASDTAILIEGMNDGEPSFIWSDWSNTGHDLTTTDWSNGYYVKTLPSDVITIIGS